MGTDRSANVLLTVMTGLVVLGLLYLAWLLPRMSPGPIDSGIVIAAAIVFAPISLKYTEALMAWARTASAVREDLAELEALARELEMAEAGAQETRGE